MTDAQRLAPTSSRMLRELGPYGLLLAVSVGLATALWMREGPKQIMPRGDVVIWDGKPADIESVVWEADQRKTIIEAKSDDWGAYYLGRYQQTFAPGERLPSADKIGEQVNESDEPLTLAQHFVATKNALKLMNDLAPLKALRAIGHVPQERLSEFGLEPPRSSVIVKFKDRERRLMLGAETAGERDQYVLEPEKQEVYLLLGDLARDISDADSRLPDRMLHQWAPTTPVSARISSPSGQRSLVRGGAKEDLFWADSARATENDTTATTWMSKIDNLRPQVFDAAVADDPAGRSLVFRIDYEGPEAQLGFFELWKDPTEVDGHSKYWGLTEQTRLPALVYATEAEQLEQDLASVLR